MKKLEHQTLIGICGWPFSGKSALAKCLRKELGVHHVDIDEVRWLAVGPPYPHPNESEELMQRDRQEMGMAYRLLIACADENLAADRSVIITATFSRISGQQMILDLAAKHPDVRFRVIQCVPETDTHKEVARRLAARDFGEDGYKGAVNSPERYFEVKERYEPILIPHIEVPTWGSNNTVEDELRIVIDYLRKTRLYDPHIPAA